MRPTQIQFAFETFASVPETAVSYLLGDSKETILFLDASGTPIKAYRRLDRFVDVEDFGEDLIQAGWKMYLKHKKVMGFSKRSFTDLLHAEVMELTSGAMAVYCLLRETHFGKTPVQLEA